jgi:Tol biopolymer transport system component
VAVGSRRHTLCPVLGLVHGSRGFYDLIAVSRRLALVGRSKEWVTPDLMILPQGKRRGGARTVRLAATSLGVAVVIAIAAGSGSPSGTTFPGKTNGLIVFQSFREGNSQLYVITSKPNQPRRLTTSRPTTNRGCYAVPAWSRDGKQIAFEYNPDPWGLNPNLSDIMVMSADGKRLVNVTAKLNLKTGFAGDPTWSPTGKTIAFEYSRTGLTGDTDVYRVNIDGTGFTRLTKAPGFDGDPSWSPGGKRIAFTSARTGNDEIYLMDTNGKGLLNISNSPAADFNPSWSPDGQLVAFESERDGNDEIYVTNDRFQLRRLTNNLALDASPSWSPDGKQIVFVSDRFQAGNRDLYVMNADGSGVRRLTQSPAWDVSPDWTSATPSIRPLPPLPPLTAPDRTPNQELACRNN